MPFLSRILVGYKNLTPQTITKIVADRVRDPHYSETNNYLGTTVGAYF